MPLFQGPIAGIGDNLKPSSVEIDKLAQQFEAESARNRAPFGRIMLLCGPDNRLMSWQVESGMLFYVPPNADTQVSHREVEAVSFWEKLPTTEDAQPRAHVRIEPRGCPHVNLDPCKAPIAHFGVQPDQRFKAGHVVADFRQGKFHRVTSSRTISSFTSDNNRFHRISSSCTILMFTNHEQERLVNVLQHLVQPSGHITRIVYRWRLGLADFQQPDESALSGS